MFSDPPQGARFSIEIIHWHIEKSLYLTRMQIHRDDMVATCGLQHVGHKAGSDGRTGLVFLVLAGIGKVGDDGRDAARGCGLAGVDHDEEFHEAIVDVAGSGGLEDEDLKINP